MDTDPAGLRRVFSISWFVFPGCSGGALPVALRATCLLLATLGGGCKSNAPAQKAVFESERFAAPLQIDPGQEDGQSLLAYARRNREDRGLIPTVYTTRYRYSDK